MKPSRSKPLATYSSQEKRIDLWFKGHLIYEVDLNTCTDSAQVLDWIFQINEKEWCTAEHLKALLDCFHEACADAFQKDPQGVWCPFGVGKSVVWP